MSKAGLEVPYARTRFESLIHEFLPALALTEGQAAALFSHFKLLNRWNARMDLTSVDTPDEMVTRHYCESLFLAERMPADEELSVVDFGSGAGFPGLPVAVLRPKWRVTLLEANQRRAVFLKEAARELSNVTVVAQRGEEFHSKHDWVVARAVKFTDILRTDSGSGAKYALLVSESSLPELNKAQGITWTSTVRLPWTQSKYCVFGVCST